MKVCRMADMSEKEASDIFEKKNGINPQRIRNWIKNNNLLSRTKKNYKKNRGVIIRNLFIFFLNFFLNFLKIIHIF